MRLSGLQVRFGLLFLIVVGCACVQPIIRATAEDRINLRSTSPFETPPELRARVDFWKDVFTRYGKFDLIVHHRMFPQAVFHVERLEYVVEDMSPADKERFVTYQEAVLKRDVAEVLRFLERGGKPFSRFEQRIDQAMKLVPGGPEKFGRAIRDDLIRVQRGIRERHQEAVRRAGKYLPYIEDIFYREGLPIELTRIPFIESSFDYEATSSVGAAGIWQFMKGTARSYMTVNSLIDERRDPFIASRAAARYLREAYFRLGSWPLAIVSYNHGVAGVAKKVSQLGLSDMAAIVEHPTERPFGFASTNFYPEFLAALEVYQDRRALFPGLEDEPPLSFRSFELPAAQSGPALARRLGVPVAQLASLNLALSSAVWRGQAQVPRGYKIFVPTQVAPEAISFVSYEAPTQSATPRKGIRLAPVAKRKTTSPRVHRVRSGESLSGIAARYQTSVSRLCAINKCRNNRQVASGEILKLP
jgi:membrane-bound lytic murein transglycosylase D